MIHSNTYIISIIGTWTKKNLSSSAKGFYQGEYKKLIFLPTRREYEENLAERKKAWDPKFTIYWEKNVEPDIEKCCMWNAIKIGWGGVTDKTIHTSNQSEHMNR